MDENTFDPPFPTAALMGVIGGAASFIHSKNQSPVEMCACSVLSASALLCQGLVDVSWRDGKKSPTSLFISAEAESGERKSENDNDAYCDIRGFDEQQDALEKESNAVHAADHDLWKLKVKESRKLIAKLCARGECTDEEEDELTDLILEEPVRRKFARMFLMDTSQPAMAEHLGSRYPYVGLNTDEGSSLFKSGVFRDFGMLNKLWEAGNWSSSRITRGRSDLRHCRFSIYMQIQPDIMDVLIERADNLYHATGFSSRALHVRAKSTQGTRNKKFVELRKEDIQPYNSRVKELLGAYAGPVIPLPKAVSLTKAASELLVWFDGEKEKELGEGGRFFYMRGAASKITENCARIAAILHTMEKMDGPITVEVLTNAIKLSAWFLNQYRLRFCPRSQLEMDTDDLDDFLTEKVAPRFAKQMSVPGPYLCRHAPRHLRQVDRLWEAVSTLEKKGKVKIYGAKGKSWHVHLTDWFPPAPSISSEMSASSNAIASRWENRVHRFIPPEPEVQDRGYELWPDAYLK